QLFVAGTTFLIIVGTIIALGMLLLRLLRRWDTFLKSDAKAAKWTATAFLLIMMGSFMFAAVAKNSAGYKHAADIAYLIGFVAVLVVTSWALRVYVIYGTVSFGLIALLAYPVTIYPALPQALGGGAARCAVIDIDQAKVSPEMYSIIF